MFEVVAAVCYTRLDPLESWRHLSALFCKMFRRLQIVDSGSSPE